ncbi:MAG TPA: hypothetical protein VGD17_15405 [Chitinophagaceae bacterium]
MAKAKKGARRKPATKKAASKSSRKPASRSTRKKAARPISMVAELRPETKTAIVNVTFIAGVGQLTASLFRNGVLINMQSISNSADIILSDVLPGDGLAVVGVSSGKTEIRISVPTSPKTLDTRPAGPIHRSYIIL